MFSIFGSSLLMLKQGSVDMKKGWNKIYEIYDSKTKSLFQVQ